MASPMPFLTLLFFSLLLQLHSVTSVDFQVGGDDGWVMPKSKNDAESYNQWAAKNRFQVDDTVRFKYKKDSVMVVTEDEYAKCRSAHPVFFSNNGDTVFKLDRPGLFYFISGVTGHCERGQKMIIKVLENTTSPPSDQNHNSTAHSSSGSGGVRMTGFGSSMASTLTYVTMSFLGFIFF
ncbi:early nodulin-like protein 1 [Carica papaya]|uniref:early nodulin-like protein 1 n=1 Tax=Carica papaya TaxID=3649 RepID=UPI000B8CFCCF|nr:early nodulin-like protein 1 [Carica papaya]